MLIHGFGCDSRFWDPQIDVLRYTACEVIAPDLPYHGGPTEGVPRSLEGLASWVLAEYLSEPAVLVGHSLGGMIALQIVMQAPALVEGIALVDSFPSLSVNAAFLNGMFVDGMDPELKSWIETTREAIIGEMTQDIYDEIWPSVVAFDVSDALPQITCPVLGIYGGRGRYSRAGEDRLAHDLGLDTVGGRSEVVVAPEAGHFVNLEFPGQVGATLTRWLETI